jgi:hypothetical protein
MVPNPCCACSSRLAGEPSKRGSAFGVALVLACGAFGCGVTDHVIGVQPSSAEPFARGRGTLDAAVVLIYAEPLIDSDGGVTPCQHPLRV